MGVVGYLPSHADFSNSGHVQNFIDVQGKIPGGIAANQRAIDAWVEEYNNVRPHEALGTRTPAEVYRNSETLYGGTTVGLEPSNDREYMLWLAYFR